MHLVRNAYWELATMTAAPRCPLQVDSKAGETRSPDSAVLPANLLSDLVRLLPCLFLRLLDLLPGFCWQVTPARGREKPQVYERETGDPSHANTLQLPSD